MYPLHRILLVAVLSVWLPACANNPNSSKAIQCERGIAEVNAMLKQAKAKGLGGTVSVTKAASLLAAAKVQLEFGKFPNCIYKVNKARQHLKRAQRL